MTFVEHVRRHARAFLFSALMLVVSGVVLMTRMPVSLFPDVTFPRIVILADNGEQPAERMMIEVTRPLEEAASAIPGVRVVRSVTGRGSTEISIGLDWDANVQETLQLLQGRLSNIRSSLPPAATIQAEQMMVSVFPILGYSLTSDSLDQVQLRDIALYQLRPALMRVPGVAQVEVTGGDTREFVVTVSPAKLAARQLQAGDVADALRRSNIVVSPGLVDADHRLYLSVVSGLLLSRDEIAACVVTVRNGVPVHISDVATVTAGVADKYIRTTARGRDAVLLNVMKQPTGSTVDIGRAVTDQLAGMKLPAGVTFENFYDQGGFIDSSIAATRDSIIVGIVLAMVVLLVFLRSWRVALVVACVVPATIAATFVCLSAVGKTINIMTLGGIAAAVGLIIDDSIVVIESMFVHMARLPVHGGTRRPGFIPLIGASVRELMPAILGSTASTIVIHIPLAFLGGITGAFFASLSVTMVFAMVLSFIFSITMAPLLASFVLTERDVAHEAAREAHPSGAHRWLERAVGTLMRHRWYAVPVLAAIGVVAVLLYGVIGSDFMPEMDEGNFVLDYKSPPGTSLDETHRMLHGVEMILMSIPEVASYSRRTGTQLGFFLTEANDGDFLVKLKVKRDRSIFAVMEEVRERVNVAQPALTIEFGQLMMDVIGDLTNNPSPIEIKIFGSDEALLHEKAREAAQLIGTVPGVVDVFDGIVIAGPSLVVHVDQQRAALAGLDATAVQDQLESIIRGKKESEVLHGEKLIPIRIRYPQEYRSDPAHLTTVSLAGPSGTPVPLQNVATIEKTSGQAEIHREGLRQMIAVTGRIEGRDMGSTIDGIKRLLGERLVLPKGVTVEYGGVYQTQQESFRGLLMVALAAVALVFIVLLIEFGEFAVPVSILIITMLSLSGVFGALWLTGLTFNISSFIGMIMVIGIVAENAVFLMHVVHQQRAAGLDDEAALVRATVIRGRPIVMTTLAAVIALLPLAIGAAGGGQMQRPLAIAVIGGFSVSSVLLFFGLPVVYRILRRGRAS